MSELTLDERLRLDALHAEAERRTTSRFSTFYPDGDGPLARMRYQKHLDFFAAGTTKERLFMAANRVGKSEAGSYELTCHLTGLYPHWWTGRRFDEPVECWAVGTNSQTTRDIVQAKLLGSVQSPGTGMIPAHLIEKTINARGLAGALEGAQVRHVSGGLSLVGLKTYEQGRQSFEGTAKHVIWCDEEPPQDCYTEMLYRTITTQGIIMVTFTPLQGMSAVVKGFLEPESPASAKFKTFIQAGWRDVPHLDPAEREALMATTPPYQIAARTEGSRVWGRARFTRLPSGRFSSPPRRFPRVGHAAMRWMSAGTGRRHSGARQIPDRDRLCSMMSIIVDRANRRVTPRRSRRVVIGCAAS